MLYAEYSFEEEAAVIREEAREEGLEKGIEKGVKQSRQYFLDLLNQGLTLEEVKQRLSQDTFLQIDHQ
jgi:hypothetical protein